jgi:hypothetical protein
LEVAAHLPLDRVRSRTYARSAEAEHPIAPRRGCFWGQAMTTTFDDDFSPEHSNLGLGWLVLYSVATFIVGSTVTALASMG